MVRPTATSARQVTARSIPTLIALTNRTSWPVISSYGAEQIGVGLAQLAVVTHKLQDSLCPPPFDGSTATVVVEIEEGGWHIGDCNLTVKGKGSLRGREQMSSMITVAWGRRLTFRGDWTFDCQACPSGSCHRAIRAQGAEVVVEGRLEGEGFCAPDIRTDDIIYDKTDDDLYLDWRDGGAILAKTVTVAAGGEVVLRNCIANSGAGGAIAAQHVMSEGVITIDNATAQGNGGGVAVKAMPPGQKKILRFITMAASSKRQRRSFKGFDWTANAALLVIHFVCQSPWVFSVNDGLEIYRKDARGGETHRIVQTPEHQNEKSWCWNGTSVWERGSNNTLLVADFKAGIYSLQYLGSLGQLGQGDPLGRAGDSDWAQTELVPGPLNPFCEDGIMMRGTLGGDLVALACGGTVIIYRVSVAVLPPDGTIAAKAEGRKTWTQVAMQSNLLPVVGISWSHTQEDVLAIAGGHRLYRYSQKDGFSDAEPGCPYPDLSPVNQIKGLQFRRAACQNCPRDDLAMVFTTPTGEDRAFIFSMKATGMKAHDNTKATCFDFDYKPLHMFGWRTQVTAMAWHPANVDLTIDKPVFSWSEHTLGDTWNHTAVEFYNGRKSGIDVHARVSQIGWLNNEDMILGSPRGSIWILQAVNPAIKSTKEEDQETPELLLKKSTFTNCRSVEGTGGSLFVREGNMSLSGVYFTNTSAFMHGGAAYADSGRVKMDGVRVETSTCSMRGHLAFSFENLLGAELNDIELGGSSVHLDIAFTNRRYLGDGKNNMRDTSVATIQKVGKITGKSGEIRCAFGQELSYESISMDACVFRCKTCKDSRTYSPAAARCVECPNGVNCSFDGADMRRPLLGTNVSVREAPRDKCSNEQHLFDKDSLVGYFLNESDKVCYSVMCAQEYWKYFAFKLGWGCDRQCAPGERANGTSREDGKACQPVHVKLQDMSFNNTRAGKMTVTVRVEPDDHKLGIKVNCTLHEVRDYTIWYNPYAWLIERKTGIPIYPKNITTEGSHVSAKFDVIQGMFYNVQCTANLSGKIVETDMQEIPSKWSVPVILANQDSVFYKLAGFVCLVWIALLIETRGEYKKRKGIVMVLAAMLGILSVCGLSIVSCTENTWTFYISVGGGSIIVIMHGLIENYTNRMLREKLSQDKVKEALTLTQEVQFPVTMICAVDFMKLDKLQSHEELRELRLLRFFDTAAKARAFLDGGHEDKGNFGVFFSHQWTAWDHPDHTGEQFNSMKAVINYLVTNKDHKLELERMYVWVDYFSIPQANPHIQKLAINSLPIYASLLQLFVIVAPEITHKNTDARLSRDTYQERGWCRAEQLCHYVKCGDSDMFLADSTGRPMPLKGKLAGQAIKDLKSGSKRMSFARIEREADVEEWFEKMFFVFSEGVSYTCCRLEHDMNGKATPCDREALMLPILGLYGDIYGRRDEEGVKEIFERIQEEGLDKIFPPTFEYQAKETGLKETRTLFGDLLDVLEAYVHAQRQEGTLQKVAGMVLRGPPK